ncbi:tetratricopeptide repeat protein [Effusibacillus consociatus]|uniref:SEC-C metal-binding domain-containing protein n=1 Tax=Effusibacillus consociatus TaxID=1117041 RepID=A0ABV9Q846_9BACL
MPNPHAAINPRLISIITGQEPSNVKEKPTLTMLPGEYARKVADKKSKIRPPYKPNKHYLICGHCGRKGQYDLGLVLFNAARWFEDDKKRGRSRKSTEMNFMDYIQATAYFRCKHCNGAGRWEEASPFLGLGVMGGLLAGNMDGQASYSTGELRLFDGSSPRWVSDGEERFLDRLHEQPNDGYLWNRLGNLYYKGGRPELAAVAFEQSIRVDPSQMESHFSLGDILLQVGEPERAAHHFRMMLVYARVYRKLEAGQMREMLVVGLQNLSFIHDRSNRSISFLPSEEELTVLNGVKEIAAASDGVPRLAFVDLEIYPDDQESFLPLAEMYMGNRRMELPAHDRTLDKHLPGGRLKQEKITERNAMVSLGSEQRPIVVKVKSEEKGKKIAQLCDRFGLHFIMGLDFAEDLTDLKKALKERLGPSDPYAPCPCGSGAKYKFCCAKKLKNFDIDRFISDISVEE